MIIIRRECERPDFREDRLLPTRENAVAVLALL